MFARVPAHPTLGPTADFEDLPQIEFKIILGDPDLVSACGNNIVSLTEPAVNENDPDETRPNQMTY